MAGAPKKPAKPEPIPGVNVGDELYFRHDHGPMSGRVLAHGAHGCTLEADGKRHRVHWHRVLGHKKRVAQQARIVDQGEDGAIVEHGDGRRAYLATPPEVRADGMMAKAHISAYTRKDGTFAGEHEDKRSAATAAHQPPGLKTEMHPTLGMRVPVKVSAVDGERGMRFHIDEDGQAHLLVHPALRNDKDFLRARHFRAIQEYLWPFGKDTFVRVHDKPEDYDHLAAGTHRGSKNWATGEMEGGLSVSRDPEFSADHAYLVSGKVIGQGSDSEPLLDMASVKVASPRMGYVAFHRKLKTAMAKKAAKAGIGEQELRALRSSVDLKFGENEMRKSMTDSPVLFLKAGPIKNRPGLRLDETKHRWVRVNGISNGAPELQEAGGGSGERRGSAAGYGTHDIQPGSRVKFRAGAHVGEGQVSAVGKHGVTVKDGTGREHGIYHHEITHFRPSPDVKEPKTENAVLGEQKPVPADQFEAADYAKSHDQADVTADSILAGFPPDTKQRIAAAQERLAGIEQTIDQHKKDGKWSAQREVLHHKIIGDFLSPERVKAATPADGEAPKFIVLGGRGGSGKSSLKGVAYDPAKAIVLDADHIKGMLPEYEGWNAAQVHEESGDLFDKITDLAQQLGLNIVHDATMKTPKKAVDLVKRFNEAGYETEAHYMHLPRQEAAKRAVSRFLGGGEKGRYVPVDVVLGNTSNEHAFDQVKHLVKRWSFRDNNVPKGKPPILISQSGDAEAPERHDVKTPTNGSDGELKKSLAHTIILVRKTT